MNLRFKKQRLTLQLERTMITLDLSGGFVLTLNHFHIEGRVGAAAEAVCSGNLVILSSIRIRR